MIHTYVTFDPRTKMLLLMTMAIFVLGGAGDKLLGASTILSASVRAFYTCR